MRECPNRRGEMYGDGYHTVLHCGRVDVISSENCFEPDSRPVFCDGSDLDNGECDGWTREILRPA